jgi:hypothetical protein
MQYFCKNVHVVQQVWQAINFRFVEYIEQITNLSLNSDKYVSSSLERANAISLLHCLKILS